MAENLKTTKYRNGDLIGTTIPASLDIKSENTPKYQWAYDDDESNVATYGRLYTWYAVTDKRNVCPTGWHVPSDAEWTIFTDYLGKDAGIKLKGTKSETGFDALWSGYRWVNGSYSNIEFEVEWWCTTGHSNQKSALFRSMLSFGNDVYGSFTPKNFGLAVRCLKNK